MLSFGGEAMGDRDGGTVHAVAALAFLYGESRDPEERNGCWI